MIGLVELIRRFLKSCSGLWKSPGDPSNSECKFLLLLAKLLSRGPNYGGVAPRALMQFVWCTLFSWDVETWKLPQVKFRTIPIVHAMYSHLHTFSFIPGIHKSRQTFFFIRDSCIINGTIFLINFFAGLFLFSDIKII